MQAVVFDLDDTLYPERDYVLSGFRAVADWAERQLGIAASLAFDELCRLLDAGVTGHTFDRWLETHDLPAGGLVPAMVAVYRGHVPRILPYPEVPGVLDHLRGRYRLALLSDGDGGVQRRKLAALGIRDRFDAVVFSDDEGRAAWKPSPRPFEVSLGRLGVRGDEAVYVGDNPLKDFVGARAVGMRTLRVRRPDGLYRHLEPPSHEHRADEEITSLEPLETMLACLGAAR